MLVLGCAAPVVGLVLAKSTFENCSLSLALFWCELVIWFLEGVSRGTAWLTRTASVGVDVHCWGWNRRVVRKKKNVEGEGAVRWGGEG